jgi:hypothetical protein
VFGAGELDGEPERALTEVDGVVVEAPEIGAGRTVDVFPAVLERLEARSSRSAR